MKISIIGGTSGFGLWTANYIKKHFPKVEITVTGRNVEKGEKVAKIINGEKVGKYSDLVDLNVKVILKLILKFMGK